VAARTHGRGRQLAKALRLTTRSLGDDSILLAGLSNHLNEEQKRELVLQGFRSGLSPVYRHFAARGEPAARSLEELSAHMTENLFEVGLRGDMLRKVDMMSMRVGLEVRVPLLDEDVAALGLELPHRLK